MCTCESDLRMNWTYPLSTVHFTSSVNEHMQKSQPSQLRLLLSLSCKRNIFRSCIHLPKGRQIHFFSEDKHLPKRNFNYFDSIINIIYIIFVTWEY